MRSGNIGFWLLGLAARIVFGLALLCGIAVWSLNSSVTGPTTGLGAAEGGAGAGGDGIGLPGIGTAFATVKDALSAIGGAGAVDSAEGFGLATSALPQVVSPPMQPAAGGSVFNADLDEMRKAADENWRAVTDALEGNTNSSVKPKFVKVAPSP